MQKAAEDLLIEAKKKAEEKEKYILNLVPPLEATEGKEEGSHFHICLMFLNPFTPTDRFSSIQNNEWKSLIKLLSVERVKFSA